MVDREPGTAADIDRTITAVARAWMGGIAALGKLSGTMWSAIQEGAFDEPSAKDQPTARVVGDNQAIARVRPQPVATIVTITPLKLPGADQTIDLEQLELSRVAVPATTATEIVVTAHPTPEHLEGTYVGELRDPAGVALARVHVPVSPPSA